MEKEKFKNIRSMFEEISQPQINVRKKSKTQKRVVSQSFQCLSIIDKIEDLEELNSENEEKSEEESYHVFSDENEEDEKTVFSDEHQEEEEEEEEFYNFSTTEEFPQPEFEEINELIQNEESFVKMLVILYNEYFLFLIQFSNAEVLTDGLKIVKQLLIGHGNFLTELKRNPFLDQVPEIIQKNRAVFEVYPNYCTLYEDLVEHMKVFADKTNEVQKKIEDSDNVKAYLGKLLTRYATYPLIFKAILKLISGKNLPNEALKMQNHIKFMEEILNKGNTNMACKKVQGCLPTEELGIYHLSDTFLVSVNNNSWGSLRVMCFTNYLLFTKQVSAEKESYKMEFLIPMSELYKVNGKDPKKLTICKFSDKIKNKYTILENDDLVIIETWSKKIEEILLDQLRAAKAQELKT